MLRYEIVSDKAGKKALAFFWMNEADGEIVVKRLLSESTVSSFSVSLCICSVSLTVITGISLRALVFTANTGRAIFSRKSAVLNVENEPHLGVKRYCDEWPSLVILQ